MDKKAEKKIKQQNADYITSRVLVGFGAAAVVLWLMSYLHRFMDFGSSIKAGYQTAWVVLGVSAVIMLAGTVMYLSAFKKGKNRPDTIFNGAFFALVSFGVLVSTALLIFDTTLGMRLIYIIVPLMAILFLIYSVYQRELFLLTIAYAPLIFLTYLMSGNTLGASLKMRIVLLVISLIVCIAVVCVVAALGKKGGQMKLLGHKVNVCGDASVKTFGIVFGAAALVAVAAAILGGTVAFYLMIAQLVFMLAAVGYYTVKLM